MVSLAKSLVAFGSMSCKSDGVNDNSKISNWMKYYDKEVGAEYIFSNVTGEAVGSIPTQHLSKT